MNKEQVVRLKLKFGPTTRPFTKPSEDYIVGCIQKLLGENNEYHDSYSNYNVSGLLGGKLENGVMTYPDGCYFLFSSYDVNLVNKVAKNCSIKKTDLYLRDVPFKICEPIFEDINTNYDIVNTVSPILLKKSKSDTYLTFKDEGFLEYLNAHCKKKLQHEGVNSKEIDTFSVEAFHFEGGRVKYPKRKNYAKPASNVKLLVKGSPRCRKILYENGFGTSTGYCFGTVKILNINK